MVNLVGVITKVVDMVAAAAAAEGVVVEVGDVVEVVAEGMVAVGETTVEEVVQILDLVQWMDLLVECLAGKW